jgi:hypothetical protein
MSFKHPARHPLFFREKKILPSNSKLLLGLLGEDMTYLLRIP